MRSPSSPFSSDKGLPTPLLISFQDGHFRFSTHYRVLCEVLPEEVASWLHGWCEQQEREHLELIAEIARNRDRAESLTLENLRVFDGLDLGIDL
jgi:hypothetical protein